MWSRDDLTMGSQQAGVQLTFNGTDSSKHISQHFLPGAMIKNPIVILGGRRHYEKGMLHLSFA